MLSCYLDVVRLNGMLPLMGTRPISFGNDPWAEMKVPVFLREGRGCMNTSI